MKKKKLNLENLKVQSFVTSLKEENPNTVKGGTASVPAMCDTDNPACANTPVCSRFAFCLPGSAYDACPSWGCSVVLHCITDPNASGNTINC